MSNNITNIENDENWAEIDLDDSALMSVLDNPLEESANTSRLRDGAQHEGFDNNMGESWIYPNNLPCRSYQMSIVQAALFRNTLVVLPTGLGKTFIAAVIMYNFYRWYPRGKIIFMAPTKPLVNQQIEACQNIMPFPKRDLTELTGKLNKTKRTEMWRTKRVFFVTPQVVQSDIIGGRQVAESVAESPFHEAKQANKTDFPFDLIKLIVIDEAHRAKGKYAYTEVAQALSSETKYFRVLALSATPGRTVEDVAEVCRNLFISHIEVRWDTSLDVLPYVHKRTMDTFVVPMGDKIQEIREELLIIVDPYLRQLTEANVLSGSLTNINRNFLLYEQKRFRDRSFLAGRHPQHSAITTNFAICVSLYHAMELLERHGLRVFLNNFEEDLEGKNKFVLQLECRLKNLVENLKKQLGPNPFEVSAAPMTNGKIAEIPKDLDFGHPKFEKTRECLLKHFESTKDSRAIVFCEYRESVMLIYRMLLQHVPLLQPRCFVGQGGTGTLRALTQKQQIQIMNDFRSGKSNILIATSIGEEGIDVGEVELIVCFDISTSNPMRFVQRIGRTGRKKNGHVIMMVTEGREQQLLREVLSNKDQINKKILKSSVIQRSLYKHSARLVPTEFKPKCIQTFCKPPSDDEEITVARGKRLSKNKTTSPKKPSQDLRKFFQTKTKQLDKEDLDYFQDGTQITQAKPPGLQTQQNIVNKLSKIKNLFEDLQTSIATQTQRSPRKKSQTKLNNSQGTIKDFFKESPTKTETNNSLNNSQTSFKDVSVATIDLCEDDKPSYPPVALESSANREPDTARIDKLRKFLKTSITSKQVLKRAQIKELGYHLKSEQLSRGMKKLLLTMRPEYLKENLEQMQVLKSLYETSETSNWTEDEKSIRAINVIILELFGGLENVEKLLDDLEFDKYKQTCLNSDSETEEDEPLEMDKFQRKLNNILKPHDDGINHDNYDWIQQRFRETNFYKEKKKFDAQKKVQESMVYETFNTPDEENTLDNIEECAIIESKYCSQWQEFNKPDMAFKSTPLPATKPLLNCQQNLKKTSLLSKLEEHELKETSNETFNTSANTKQVQNLLLLLENKLKETSFKEVKTPSIHHDLPAKIRNDNDIHLPEADQKICLIDHFEDFNLPDDEDLIKAVEEAEYRFTQHQSRDVKKSCTTTSSYRDSLTNPGLKQVINNTKEEINSSLQSTTPAKDMAFGIKHRSAISVTSSEQKQRTGNLCLHHGLDIDMEAFMEPFPEEQELLKSIQPSQRKESLKKHLSSISSPAAFVRESPDLFAAEHTNNTIRKPIVCKQSTLANKLAAKLNLKKSEATLNPTTSFKSPQSPIPQEVHNSPSNRLASDKDKDKYVKSPSLFDMYLKNTKGKAKLPKSLKKSASLITSAKTSTSNINNSLKESPPIDSPGFQQNESVIMLRNRKGIASKRKIFDSDSDSEHEDDKRQRKGLKAINFKSDEDTNSDFDEVAATQRPNEASIFRQRRKRRRYNSFIQEEAAVSGSDQSEAEHTIGRYAYDSIVVASDEEDPDQASTSYMQAMYLQSLKSPPARRGTFKIPAPRAYNDHSRIFSQAVIPQETYSQYLPDSFVVDEENCTMMNNNAEVSLCPLERAEKILKERRRAKKYGLLPKNNTKRNPKTRIKLQTIEYSSEDDDFE